MMRTRLFQLALIIGMVNGGCSVLAVEWSAVDLSGEFEGINETKGTGQRSYSFALRRTVEQGGDLTFSLNFSSSKETLAVLQGGRFLDLGALSAPPTSLVVPKDFLGQYENPKYRVQGFLIGHYYYMSKDPLHVLLQITDFTAGPRSTLEKKWYGATERGTGRISFRYVSSDGGVEGLNNLLGGGAPISKPSVTEAHAATEVSSAVAPGGEAHIVRSGETLAGIAEKYGVTRDAIIELNKITGDRIRVGQRLSLPGAANETSRNAPIVDAARPDRASRRPTVADTNMTPAALVAKLQSLHEELVDTVKAHLRAALDSAEPEVEIANCAKLIDESKNGDSYFGLAPAISNATARLGGGRKGIEEQQASTPPELREQYGVLLKDITLIQQSLKIEQDRMQILRERLDGLSKSIANWQDLYRTSRDLLGTTPAREKLKQTVNSGAKAWLANT